MKVNQREVIDKVTYGLGLQFQEYTFQEMIDDCDLTDTEKKWAKENLDYKVVKI